MRVLAVIFALGIQGSFGSPEASFRWLEERSADGIPHLAITYADGTMDHAILERYNPIPAELDKTNSPVGGCLFRGNLTNEMGSMVVVAGCAGDDSFHIATASQKRNLYLTVEKGIGRTVKNTFTKEALYAPEIQKKILSTERVAFPTTGLVFNLAVFYDRNWNTRYTKVGSPFTPADAVRKVVALSQIIFNWPSLGVPISLKVVSLEFKNEDIPSEGAGLDKLATYPVDNNVIHSRVGFTTIGSSGGIAYVGSVCFPAAYAKYKTAVVSGGSNWPEQSTAEIMAHELGHNLGMPHDFVDPYGSPKTPRYDSMGVSCTNANGVMDYYVTVTKWSTCSKEIFQKYYDQTIASNGRFCMGSGTPVNGNWGQWSAWGTCSAPCGGGTQTRTRLCDSPAPSGGGAGCSGSATESQACNTQTCTNTNWGGYAFYLCSSQLSSSLGCGTGYKLKVHGAGWMRKSATICPAAASQMTNLNCFLDVTTRIAAICEGKASCRITLPTGLNDPCFGTNKYLQFNLSCVPM